MADQLPPSRFGAGYSMGQPPQGGRPSGRPPREGRGPWPWIVTAVVVCVALVVGATAFYLVWQNDEGNSAGSNQRGESPIVTTVPTVLILDASGSMTTDDAPGPRIDAAKEAAQVLVDALPDDATIGLTTYGTGTGATEAERVAGCQDVTALIPLGQLDRDEMEQQISALVPAGYTPISLALQRAADQLPADDSAQAIVLVSDGEDSCDIPPCDTAAQLKQTHPGLTISTVGFKTDGPASEQLACIAAATGGLFVGAANAEQLANRLIAVQNVDLAKQSLTEDGIDDIKLGQSLDEIRSSHPNFPDGSRQGEAVIVYVDCDFGFIDGVLDYIAPHDGGRTIDGVTPGSDLSDLTKLYGDPVSVDPDAKSVVYRADSDNDESENGYRVTVDGFSEGGGQVSGTVATIVLCRCAPSDIGGLWTDPVVIVTPNSVGAATLGMSEEEIEAAAGVQIEMPCTQCDGYPTALLPDNVPMYTAYTNPERRHFRVWSLGRQSLAQAVMTAEGFRLGDSVDELLAIYGDRLQPYESLGLNSVRGFVLAGDGGYLIFNAIDTNGTVVHEFVVQDKI